MMDIDKLLNLIDTDEVIQVTRDMVAIRSLTHHEGMGMVHYLERWFKDIDIPEEKLNKDRPKRSHGVAEGCTLCAHLLDAVGEDGKPQPQVPACVAACKNGALTIGDMNDTTPSGDPEPPTVYELLRDSSVKRLKEDLGTEPKVHYIGL